MIFAHFAENIDWCDKYSAMCLASAIIHMQTESLYVWISHHYRRVIPLSSRFEPKREKKEAEREQKAWKLIRTVTGVVAKLISQKEIGRKSISVSSREANLPGTPQGEQPWKWLLTPKAEWLYCKSNLEATEIPICPRSECAGKLVSVGYSPAQF